jgi:hypothetical protein
VGGAEVIGRSGGVLNEGNPKAVVPTPQVEIPIASVMANTLNPSMGEECRKADLDTTLGEDARSRDLKVA